MNPWNEAPPNSVTICPPEGPPTPSSATPQSSETPPPPQPTGPTKALDIVADYPPLSSLQDIYVGRVDWQFFATDYGKKVDCRTDPVYREERTFDATSQALNYPGGTFSLKLFDEDCEYKNSGDNVGALFCGGRTITCVDDPADTNPSDINADKGNYQCGDVLREPVFTCAW